MANAQAGSVIRVDTSAQFSGNYIIGSVRFIGTTGASAFIQEGSNTGMKIWEESGTANTHSAELDAVLNHGFYITVASGAVVYLYLD